MKKGKLGLIVAMVLLLPIMATAGNSNPWEKKLPFKGATIHYTLSGMEQGVETLYIRESGRETATYHKGKTSMMGMVTNTDTIEIETPDWVYTFDLITRTGTKSANPQKYMIEEYQRLTPAEQKQVVENVKKMSLLPGTEAMGAKVEPKAAKILGYDCDKVQMMGTTVYSLHDTGIPLKMDSNMMGMSMKQEATSIDEGAVSAKYFEPPPGIEAVADPQADAQARDMARQTLAMLKSPDGAKKMEGQGPVNPLMAPGEDGQQMTPEEKQEMEQAMEMMKGMMGGQQK
jgi:hypothetical protein